MHDPRAFTKKGYFRFDNEFVAPDVSLRLKFPSASSEPAWNNGHVGIRPGVLVWRIEGGVFPGERFYLAALSEEKTGLFFNGDCYVILHSRELNARNNRYFSHELYVWVGERTTYAEATVAAYKALELDEYLGGGVALHREIQSAPSDGFMHIFPRIEIRRGGARTDRLKEAGLPLPASVQAEENVMSDAASADGGDDDYYGRARSMKRIFKLFTSAEAIFVVVMDLRPSMDNLNDEDMCMVDTGDRIWVWSGRATTVVEKSRVSQLVYDVLLERPGTQIEYVSQNDDRSNIVYSLLGASEVLPPSTTTFAALPPVESLWATGQASHRPRRLLRALLPEYERLRERQRAKATARGDPTEEHDANTSDAGGGGGGDDGDDGDDEQAQPDSGGPEDESVTFELIKEDTTMTRDDLPADEVMVLDTGFEVWVWQGAQVPAAGIRLWLRVARDYLREAEEREDPEGEYMWRTGVVRVVERRETQASFLRALKGY
jgi:gelsolin